MKVDDGDLPEDADAGQEDGKTKDLTNEAVNGTAAVVQNDSNPFNSHQTVWSKRDNNQRTSKVLNKNCITLLIAGLKLYI